MRLEGATALVTGAASGLGRATVDELLLAGARVVAVDLVAVDGLEPGTELEVMTGDVANDGDIEKACARAVDRFGALHVAINCAGVAVGERLVGREGLAPVERFRQVIDVNLSGTLNVARHAAAAMLGGAPRDGERGVLVTTASAAAYDGQIGQAAYAASKAGVAGMTLPVARELAKAQIRCVAIAPGLMDTPMLQKMPAKVRAGLAAQVPHPRRLGDPAEYARLACHIVENPLLNGTVIRLDGALRMGAR